MSRLRLLVGGEPVRLVGAVALGVGAILSSIGLLTTAAYLISRAALLPPILDLTVAIVGVRFFGISRGVFRYAERLASHDLSLRVSASLRVRMADALTRLLPGKLEDTHTGDLLLRIISDADAWQHVITRVFLPPIIAVVVVVSVFVFGWLLLPAAGLLLLAALLLAGLVLSWVANRLGRWSEAEVGADRQLLAETVLEMVDGAPEIVTYGQEEAFLGEMEVIEDRLQARAMRTAWVGGFGDAAVLLLIGLAEISMLAVAIPAVVDGRLPGVQLAVVALLGLVSFEAVHDLPRAYQNLGASLAAAGRVEAIITAPGFDDEPINPQPMPERPHLALEGIELRYATRPEPVLRGVTVDLPPGSRTALIGENGAGKTSVAHILLRFREPDGGVYRIDGVDAGCYSARALRRRVGFVDDRAFVFAGSVRQNLLLAGPDADDARITDACDRAGMGEWLADLPDGLDTVVGEDTMSGGERRRLALARALLANFAVLVLDEPTAGLDDATAGRVLDSIVETTRGRTLLLITHRAAGIAAMDRVLTMKSGIVVEESAAPHRAAIDT
jgi:thiol reductant ABC exporter CydC subunit